MANALARNSALRSQRRANLARARAARSHDFVTVKGLREAIKALSLAPKEIRDELNDALREGAEKAARVARVMSPRSNDGRAPTLSSSIRTKLSVRGALVGSPLVYAPVINFGRKRIHVGPGHRHKVRHVQHLTKNPFLPEAVERVAPEIERDMAPRLQVALDRALSKAGVIAHG